MLQRSDPQVQRFYKSKAWQRCRESVMARHNWICQLCGRPASICHHIEEVTAANVFDPRVTLNPDNLMCLCYQCHNQIHSDDQHVRKTCRDGLAFDSDGNLVEVTKGERWTP